MCVCMDVVLDGAGLRLPLPSSRTTSKTVADSAFPSPEDESSRVLAGMFRQVCSGGGCRRGRFKNCSGVPTKATAKEREARSTRTQVLPSAARSSMFMVVGSTCSGVGVCTLRRCSRFPAEALAANSRARSGGSEQGESGAERAQNDVGESELSELHGLHIPSML